jgi:hypothetical protein
MDMEVTAAPAAAMTTIFVKCENRSRMMIYLPLRNHLRWQHRT